MSVTITDLGDSSFREYVNKLTDWYYDIIKLYLLIFFDIYYKIS
jgi:hypothetical protein